MKQLDCAYIQLMFQSLLVKFSRNQCVWVCAVVNEKGKYFLEKSVGKPVVVLIATCCYESIYLDNFYLVISLRDHISHWLGERNQFMRELNFELTGFFILCDQCTASYHDMIVASCYSQQINHKLLFCQNSRCYIECD